MLGTEVLEADEETLEGQILSGKTTKMNGTNGKNGGTSSDVKYPANCAMRLSSTPGSDGDENDPYEPKQNKKIVRILTVMVYVFTVSFGKNFDYTIRYTLQQVRIKILKSDFTASIGRGYNM